MFSLKPNRRANKFSRLLAVLFLICACSTQARDFPDLPDVLEDPLLTRPPMLETGPILPGDNVPIPCPANKDFNLPLALGEAVDIALCNNPRIKKTWAAIKVQAGALGEARSAYLPSISGTVSGLHNHTAYPGTSTPSTSKDGDTLYASLSWRLFDFGGRAANHELAEKLLEAALASHDAELQKTLVMVIQAYFDAITSEAILIAQNESIRVAQATLDTARRREAGGAASQSDTLQAVTALARASLDRQRAQGNNRKAVAVLVQVMGLPSHTQIALPGKMDEFHAETAKDLDTWIAEAEQRHPAIIAARAQWEAAGRKVSAVRSEGMPTIDFTANYYENGYPNQGLQSTQTQVGTVGLVLTVPLFEGFSRTYKIRGAQAQVEAREAELADTRQQVLTEVVKAHSDAVSSLASLQASETLLKAAQASQASSGRRYGKGAADILEVLNTQSALAAAEQERIRVMSEWRSARLRLMANAGALGRIMIESAKFSP